MSTVKIDEWDCTVELARYRSGQTAIVLNDAETGERVAVASVAIPEGRNLPINHTFIKNWSENKGILEVLVNAGIVRDTGEVAATGDVVANLVEILKSEPVLSGLSNNYDRY